jgi:hypothetical protein
MRWLVFLLVLRGLARGQYLDALVDGLDEAEDGKSVIFEHEVENDILQQGSCLTKQRDNQRGNEKGGLKPLLEPGSAESLERECIMMDLQGFRKSQQYAECVAMAAVAFEKPGFVKRLNRSTKRALP